MEDFMLFQWLVVGLLAAIVVCNIVLLLGLGLDNSLEAMTRRLEIAIAALKEHV